MAIDLFRVIQPVTDIEAAAAFYGKVLGVPGERVSPGRHYFDCGGTILACYDPLADGDDMGDGWRHHSHQYVYFTADDIEALPSRIEDAGGKISSAIEWKPWGERIFYAHDPFGNPIAFVEAATAFLGGRSTS